MKSRFILFLYWAVVRISFAQAPLIIPDKEWNNMPNHPRLFANESKIKELRLQKDKVSKQLWEVLKYEADKKLTAQKIEYPTTGFKFYAVREAQSRILNLALYYRLSGERKYFEKAREELLQLAALSDWCPGHFLDVGEASFTAGVGLDWLYNDLSMADRKQIVSAIVKNALLPSLEVKETQGSWVVGDFNWNQVCHSGLSVGALAISEYEPDLSRKVTERAIKYIPYAGAVYNPDGVYPEGPSYWAYGTIYHVLLIEALRSVFNTAYGLEKFPGFLKTADYRLQMIAPSGNDFNYADYHNENQNDPLMLWFARELKRSDVASPELIKINSLHTSMTVQASQITKPQLKANRQLAFDLLWWDNQLPIQQDTSMPLHWTASGILPLAVMRSAWHDSLATMVAIKGGTSNYSHAHMDVGSFILEARGVRWAIDLGTESYDKMRAAKLDLWNYSQNSTRWSTFRVGPEGHNILRFNNEMQISEASATINYLPVGNDFVGDVVTLTPLYKGQVEMVNRTVKLNKDKSVTIEDEWKTLDEPMNVSWQWLTQARVTQKADGLLLQQDRKSLMLQIKTNAEYSLQIEDVAAPANVQDSPNPGLTRIVVKLLTPARQLNKLTVKAMSLK